MLAILPHIVYTTSAGARLLSLGDGHTRQAYTLARSVGSSTSPIVSGLLLQGPLLVLGLPFILAGVLKATYDGSLWLLFRHVHLAEGEVHSPHGSGRSSQST